MDLTKHYFYITVHFSPDYSNEFKCISDNQYINTLNKEVFRKRLLYDFGWGQETGFELLPALSFEELIELVEQSTVIIKNSIVKRYTLEEIRNNRVNQSNLFGAVSVIMQDHVEELIEFLTNKIETDYFSCADIRKNFIWFSFSSSKMKEIGKIPGGNLTKSYEDVLNEYAQWKKISEKVIFQVYG